ncbi:hypothetical protein [Micromonospora thermarum]|uniref:Uncharacterized protein n=1 Tax=Micromonospora thermarum TaxID=2720024 RepID=A0ABX0Z521_9ACTN|nr:hypothetical protein [Micromonospora thermarum]NJP32409.1 hypothetical protein [Micromonospora thermarum]
MTRAPENLLALRGLLLAHLNVDPKTVRSQDLEPAEVGIVGDSNHRGGYHCGSDRVVANDYSVVESPRDSSGLTLDAAALDVGLFQVGSGGGTHTLRTFSVWCVQQCVANAPDARDIREIIYSPDGRTVRRWDRLGRRTTGDNSHLWHTHFSFFRDSIKAGRDQTPLFRRYLASIGLLEDDMPLTDADQPIIKAAVHNTPIGRSGVTIGEVLDQVRMLPGQVEALRNQLTQLAARDFTDEPAIIQGVLAGLTPEKIAAAIPPTLAKQVADELARRLSVGAAGSTV